MREKLIIFGTKEEAEVAFYYFTHDSDYDVIGFCVDKSYKESDSFCSLPVYDFETIEHTHSPADTSMFISIGFSKLNRNRRAKYDEAKAKGYRLASYISSKATVLNDGAIGDNCFILEDNTVQPFSRIGNNVTVWSGNHIGHHSVLEDDCFISSHVVISGNVIVGRGCFIGVNSTLRDHITVGEYCLLGAGTILLKNAPPKSIYGVHGTPPSKLTTDDINLI